MNINEVKDKASGLESEANEKTLLDDVVVLAKCVAELARMVDKLYDKVDELCNDVSEIHTQLDKDVDE